MAKAAGSNRASFKGWKRAAALSLLLFFTGLTVYGQLDGLLRAMHLPGEAPVSLNAVLATNSAEGAERAVYRWQLHNADLSLRQPVPTFTGGLMVASWALVVDNIAIVPAYVALLVLLGLLLTSSVAPSGGDEMGGSAPSVARLAWALPLSVAIADLLENTVLWWIVKRDWIATVQPARSRTLGFSTGSPDVPVPAWVVNVGFVASKAKVALLVATVIFLVMAALASWSANRRAVRRWFRSVVAARFAIIPVVGLFAVFRVIDQGPDIIRGWNAATASFALVLGAALSWVTFDISRRAIRS